ncbi:MAG: sensor histidine kinase, partial [Terriglobia bacterium]
QEQLKNEFIATVSHELRTPLTSIIGSLRLIESGAAGQCPDAATRLFKISLDNCQRLVAIVNDILDIEKIDAGKMTFADKPVDVLALLDEVAEANQGMATQHGVVVRLDRASAPGSVSTDPDRLTQVITNLVSNGIKFSPRGSDVVLSTEASDDLMCIKVRDHGPGIPNDYKDRIFEKFVQVDATDQRWRGGTGLGLSIAKQIMSQLGGTIGFEDATGGGTVFTVELKAIEAAMAFR